MWHIALGAFGKHILGIARYEVSGWGVVANPKGAAAVASNLCTTNSFGTFPNHLAEMARGCAASATWHFCSAQYRKKASGLAPISIPIDAVNLIIPSLHCCSCDLSGVTPGNIFTD